jgi:hypothetical protein
MKKTKQWWEYIRPGHTLKCIDPKSVKKPALGANYGGSGWSKDKIIKVRVINVHGDYAAVFYEGSAYGVYSYACEPCYQVGDWVIDESAKAPAAYKIISVNKDSLMISKNSCFYSNQHGLRYATKEEIDKAILLNNSLSVNDLIIGNFYKITDPNGTFLIIKFRYNPDDLNRIAGTYISNMNSIWEFKTSSNVWYYERRIEVATEEEIIWLEACIEEDKFIKKEDIKKDTLPEKWCVKASDIPRDLMEKWRKAALGISTYVDDNEYLEHTSFRIDPSRYPDRIILPFEQVKDYIYNKITGNSPIIETPVVAKPLDVAHISTRIKLFIDTNVKPIEEQVINLKIRSVYKIKI